MGRAKPSTMREGIKLGNGIPFFGFDMGKKYKIVFPSVAGDIFAYMETVHTTNLNGKFGKIRCTNADFQVNEESKAAVQKLNEHGEFAVDPATGRVLNDGSCPVCELHKLYKEFVFAEGEKFKAENPTASEKEVKAFYRDLFKKAPVEAAYDKNSDGVTEIQTTKILLGLVYLLDEKGNYVLDSEGSPQYVINVFDLSEARYKKLYNIAETNKEYLSETLTAITDESGFAWTEFIWDFPKRDDKPASGKDLVMSIVPSGHSAIEKYNALHGKIVEELGDGEKYEKLFEGIGSIRIRTIPEIEKDLQGKLQTYRTALDKDAKEQLGEELDGEEKHISETDGETLLAETEATPPQIDLNESGADAFLG